MGWTEKDLTNYITRLNRLKQEDAQKRANNGIVRALKKQRLDKEKEGRKQ